MLLLSLLQNLNPRPYVYVPSRERAKQKADALQHKTEALAKSLEQAEQEKRLLEAELGALQPAGRPCRHLPLLPAPAQRRTGARAKP